MKDLVVLVADNQAKATVDELLLSRRASLGLRDFAYEILVHPKRDPGCYQTSHDLLRSQSTRYQRCLVIFDREGCGRELVMTADEIAGEVQNRLALNGWQATDVGVVVIDPELEAWVWCGSIHVARIVCGVHTIAEMEAILRSGGYVVGPGFKPSRPKEAMEYALRRVGRPHSAAVFSELAKCVGLSGCQDPAFAKLRAQLSGWFPA